MFWIIVIIIIGVIIARQFWRDSRDAILTILFTCYFIVLAAVVSAIAGMIILPSIFEDKAETTTIVLEDKILQAFPDNNYIHISDIGYSTLHYTLRERVNENSYRDFTLKNSDYFQTIYANKDFHFIKSKTTFSNPIIRFFTFYWETDITIKIPPHSIALEENMYVEP